MAPKRPASAAASGSASDASDAEAATGGHRRRRHSPSPVRSRSRSKTPPSTIRPNAAALSSTPTSAGADYAAASDSDADGRVPSPRGRRERSRIPRSDSDVDAVGRIPAPLSSPRRSRDGSPRFHSDSDPDNFGASENGGEGNVSTLPRARRSTRIETSNIKPVSSRLMGKPGRAAGASSSQGGSKRRHRSPALPTAEHHKRAPRVWSHEDEVTILRALIAFRGKKGRLPSSIQDTGKLESQIRGQLTANASTTQLSDKIRRLKHKYKLLAIRAKKGREPDLPTDHDREMYELSNKVWGYFSIDGFVEVGGSQNARDEESNEDQEIEESDEGMESGWDVHDQPKKVKAFRFENGSRNAIAANGNAFATGGSSKASQGGGGGGKDVSEKRKQMYPYLWEAVEELSKDHPSGQIFRKAFGVLEKAKAHAIEEKLRKFRMSEIRQQLRRMDLMKDTVTMVLDALEDTG